MLCLFSLVAYLATAQEEKNVRITILSTMLADMKGKGEWGFSALVEVDSVKLLFDTGKHPELVLENAKALDINLAGIERLVLSHNHLDHTGGVERLLKEFPSSFAQVYIATGFFTPKLLNGQTPMKSFDSSSYVRSGGTFTVISSFHELLPGIYLTGPVPRIHDEENYPKTTMVKTAGGTKVDIVEEDMSLVINTSKGLVLLSGCGHAGIVNTLEQVRKNFPGKKVIAAIGGFHLLETDETKLTWTANEIKKAGVEYFVGAHCTGLNSVYKIRQIVGFSPAKCLIGSVGMVFDLQKGIKTGWLE
jgi:7,8-dihydropterin-6-yl-methyl-4-(beta-D-ribofuranosyl)aminobenzene 5'-phosphate synthase